MSGQYNTVRLLGKGGFGVVSLVSSKSDPSQLFALKQINVRDFVPTINISAEKLKMMANQEAENLKYLEHPNIVKVYGSFMEGDFLSITMEFCDSGTLKDEISAAQQNGQIIPEVRIRNWIKQVAKALEFVHRKKYLHRDIKSNNVFLTHERETVKLGDFGIAKLLEGTTAAHTFIGTFSYLPPEMWTETPRYSSKSEVWALGVLIYELAALRLPFAGALIPLKAIQNDMPQPLPSTSYSAELRVFVETKMLQKKETDRPSISEVFSFFAPSEESPKTPVTVAAAVITASDQYIVERVLGQGGFGKASLAHSKSSSAQKFVVKVVNLDKVCSGSIETADKIRKMAFQEAEIMKKIQHPNIVHVFSSFIEGSEFFIVMEYCDSGTLKDIIRKASQEKKCLQETQILRWMAQLVMTLKHLHNNNILHRDVKSENIFAVNQGQTLKLGDFGIAKTLDATSAGHTFLGTMTHIPPELWDMNISTYNFKSEVWALGITAYEMIALELPFVAGLPVTLMTSICLRPVKPLPDGTYSSELRTLVEKELLAKQPENRPSMDALIGKPCILSAIVEMANSSSGSASAPIIMPTDNAKNEVLSSERQREKNTTPSSLPSDFNQGPIMTGDAVIGDYYKFWNKKPTHRLFTSNSAIQAIFQCPNLDAGTSKPLIVIICQDGDVIAFSANNWQKIEWRRKLAPAVGDKNSDKVEIWHATYDETAENIYVVQSLNRQAIYHASKQTLVEDVSRNGVSLDIVVTPEQAGKRNFRGLSFDGEQRLLFACVQNDRTVTIWRIADRISLTTRLGSASILIGTVACKINPWLCAVFCGDHTTALTASLISQTASNVVVLAVSDTMHDRVDLFTAPIKEESDNNRAIDDFRFLAALQTKTPAEITFDSTGNLFCTGFDTNRLHIFSSKASTKSTPMQAIWTSNDCGAMLCRINVAVNPQTGRPAALVASNNALDCFE